MYNNQSESPVNWCVTQTKKSSQKKTWNTEKKENLPHIIFMFNKMCIKKYSDFAPHT